MRLLDSLFQGYYRWKYRPYKNRATRGACAIGCIGGAPSIFFLRKKKADGGETGFEERAAALAKRTAPCYHTNKQLRDYLRGNYTLHAEEMSESELANCKQACVPLVAPQLLKTPNPVQLRQQMTRGKTDKPLSRAQFWALHDAAEQHTEEIAACDTDALGLRFTRYVCSVPMGERTLCAHLSFEETGDLLLRISCTTQYDPSGGEAYDAQASKASHEAFRAQANAVSAEIECYKGVTQEDIDTLSPRFLGYARTVFARERAGAALG